jgi:hypothetical protein
MGIFSHGTFVLEFEKFDAALKRLYSQNHLAYCVSRNGEHPVPLFYIALFHYIVVPLTILLPSIIVHF